MILRPHDMTGEGGGGGVQIEDFFSTDHTVNHTNSPLFYSQTPVLH